MPTSSIVKPWSRRPGKQLEFVPLDPQKPFRIKNQMLESLQYVKSHQTKERDILDLQIKTFFEAIFEAGKLGLDFTTKERQEIGPLIKECIWDMDDCLFGIGEGFDIDQGPQALVVRSGLQFMVDNFKNFPDGNSGTLEQAFHHFWEFDTVHILDNSLARWKENPIGCEENIWHSSEALDRPKDVPVSHHWWF